MNQNWEELIILIKEENPEKKIFDFKKKPILFQKNVQTKQQEGQIIVQ